MKSENEILSFFETEGRRPTKLRRRLAELFTETKNPLSVAGLLVRLADKGLCVNKTTVYRELRQWENLGLIHPVLLGDRQEHYELSKLRIHHHHFVCTNCEKVADIALDERSIRKTEQAMTKAGYSVFRHSLEFFGLCAACK